MKKVYWLLLVLLIFSFFFIQKTFAILPSYFDVICDIDFDFLENNICSGPNCLFQINKSEPLPHSEEGSPLYSIKYSIKENPTIFGFTVLKFNNSPDFDNYTILRSRYAHLDFTYLNETQISFLSKVCREDISPVINRIKQGSLPCCNGRCNCLFAKYSKELEDEFKNKDYDISKFDGWMIIYHGANILGMIIMFIAYVLNALILIISVPILFLLDILFNPLFAVIIIVVILIIIFVIKNRKTIFKKKDKKH